jgi:hypothetical protein
MDQTALLDAERRAASGDSEARLKLARFHEGRGDFIAARRCLEQGAAAGDVAAKTALGQLFLVRPGMPVADGIRLIVEAAQSGGAEAAHQVAVFAAAGAGIAQDWTTAFDFLQRAAELGHPRARSSLEIFAGQRGNAAAETRDHWKAVRQAIDLQKWLTPPPAKSARQSPRIWIVEKFLPVEVCNWLIERARPKMGPARVYDKNTAEGNIEEARTNSFTDFNIIENDVVLCMVRQRIATATGLPLGGMEHTAVLHYSIGQQFKPHFDFLDPNIPAYAKEVAERGQRVSTFLGYLNDGYEGAETDFPRADWRYKGGAGDAMFFSNVELSGAPDRQSLHAGLAPTRGEKWLLSQFIRGQRSP